MELDNGVNLSSPSNRLAPFNPVSEDASSLAIELLRLTASDVLCDLGCGDGRFLIQACQKNTIGGNGLKCVGIECNQMFVERGIKKVQQLKLEEWISIRHGDVMDFVSSVTIKKEKDEKDVLCFSDATAIFLYLVPSGLRQVRPFIESLVELKRREHEKCTKDEKQQGEKEILLRVVSYMFAMPDWIPTTKQKTNNKAACPVYYYEFQ